MRASRIGLRVMRASTGLDGESRRQYIRSGAAGASWSRRCISVYSDPRKLKLLPKTPQRVLMLTLGVLTMIFLFFTVSTDWHSFFGQSRHTVSTRPRVRSDPCTSNLPEVNDIDDGGRGASSDGKSITGNVALLLGQNLQLGKRPSIGLLNIGKDEALGWQEYAHGRIPIFFPFAQVNQSLAWSDFYPEWIDEEELFETPMCPSLPFPCVREKTKLDLLVAKVSCQNPQESGGERNVQRLQLFLSAASIASQTGDEAMDVLIISECRPPLNIFPCGELLEHEGKMWLYHVNLVNMRSRLVLPVGSCELSLSINYPEQLAARTGNERRQAYVSMVHTDASYVCGAIVLAHSIRLSGSTRDLVMLVDSSILPEQRRALQAAGWQVREIERIRNPYAEKDRYNEWNYSKFRLWQITEYDKIVFIDSDLLVLRNIDFLFQLPEISATGNDQNRFNSGVMVIEPSNCTFGILLDQIMDTRSYNGGDQGYLNEIFPWWHRLPKRVNFLKHFWSNDTDELETKTRLFGEDPPELYVLHYLGMKPWVCFRDYDCNWNLKEQQKYASDSAHATWFKIHDSMPENLQRQCWLRTLAKAAREVERREAEAGSYSDGHWKIKIRDPRLELCPTPEHCDWEEMIRHWNEPPPQAL
uniref:Hexosyltransferase n=1 Tax=Physcomitrium patens TaxID=3218 RepID=A0A7I4BW91_PHYPA|nr:putative UDP-glucuronate:xylan alpha-glucuronosyltransferase 3 [Physcomitrium patens]|eukprot:XP_024370263.1 putative UDP-glucuronate:xylan alpha-glucuronosyltransferase 3 [Physcomitrella patens]